MYVTVLQFYLSFHHCTDLQITRAHIHSLHQSVNQTVYRIIDFLLKDLPTRIEAGEVGPAILLASVKIGVAAITAAAVSG